MPSLPIKSLLRLPALLFRYSGPLLVVSALLAGLIVAGRWAHERVRSLDRYHFPFAEIECPAPPGATRADFLAEVQYLGSLPDRVSLVETDLPSRLNAAFAKHPWVERVERVEIGSHRVEARLLFRTPALVVAEHHRVVDTNGILLPASAPTTGLPILSQKVKPPAGPAGTRWGDERVEAAARGLVGR